MTRVIIQPSPVVEEEQAAELEQLVEDLRGAGFEADLRPPDYGKAIPPEVFDVAVTVVGALQDHVIDAVVAYAIGRLGRRGAMKQKKRKIRVFGPNGQVIRDVEIDEDNQSDRADE